MPMPKSQSGQKNMVGLKLKQLREERGLSQRELAKQFQLMGCDIDQNVITRIETRKRHVTEIELRAIMEVFDIPSTVLLEENDVDIQVKKVNK